MDHGALMQYLISRETRDCKADLTFRRTYLPPNSQRGGRATRALRATDRVGRGQRHPSSGRLGVYSRDCAAAKRNGLPDKLRFAA